SIDVFCSPSTLNKIISLATNCISNIQYRRRTAKVLGFSYLNPFILCLDLTDTSRINLLHRIAEKTKAELPAHLAFNSFQSFNNVRRSVLAFINKYDWKLLRKERSEEWPFKQKSCRNF